MANLNLGGWLTIPLERDNIIGKEVETHCVPLGDYRDHELWAECWCKPTMFESDCYRHHAMDKRESYEEGRKLQ